MDLHETGKQMAKFHWPMLVITYGFSPQFLRGWCVSNFRAIDSEPPRRESINLSASTQFVPVSERIQKRNQIHQLFFVQSRPRDVLIAHVEVHLGAVRPNRVAELGSIISLAAS
jgi:hypothetical protein